MLTKDPKQRPSIKKLARVPIICDALNLFIKEFEGEIFFYLRNYLPILFDLSFIDLPRSPDPVLFVYLWGDRLYTEAGKTLYVYSLTDLTSPCKTYPLRDKCLSALITENRLYLGGWNRLLIFEVTSSLNGPLIPVTKIRTKQRVFKILRVGDDLLLG